MWTIHHGMQDSWNAMTAQEAGDIVAALLETGKTNVLVTRVNADLEARTISPGDADFTDDGRVATLRLDVPIRNR